MSYPPFVPGAIGWTLALVALVLLLVLIVTGQLPLLWVGVILMLLALARLV
jgi:hypothetical protein